MKLILYYCIFAITSFTALGQNLVQYEYYFNSDPGLGNATLRNITGDELVIVIDSVEFSDFAPGVHNFCVRFKDEDGTWSSSTCRFIYVDEFFKLRQLIAAEYYIDTDPGLDNATPLTIDAAQELLLVDSVPFTNLVPGMHNLCIRFKNSDNIWSGTTCRLFYVDKFFGVGALVLTEAEYYFDTDPGFGNATPIALEDAQEIILLDSIPFNNFEFGFHNFCIRFKNNQDAWSSTVCRLFYVDRLFDYSAPMLIVAEYYIDDDPGLGNATPFTIDPEFDIVIIDSIDLDNIERGFHSICFRFKNADDVWTQTVCRNFLIDEFIIDDSEVIAGEFWLGNDPGMGNANPIRFVQPGLEALMFDQADLDGLEPGTHYIYIRTRNDKGVWGQVFAQEFEIDGVGVPKLIYPPDMADDVEIIPTTEWQGVPSATSYKVEISTDFLDFDDNIIFSQSVAFITELVVPEGTLDTGKTYYWRVNATVGGNQSDWSAYFTFTTKDDLVKFVIQLAQGWNMVSSNTESDVPKLAAITSGISDKMVIMKDNLGNIYYPQFEIDLIENWDVTQGYQIFMSQAANLNIWGKPINPTTKAINLNSGWNMVSYLRNSNMSPETALNSMVQAGVLVIMKDNLGNIYYPDFEIDTIELMKPGQGYQMFLLSPFNLNYPAN